MSPGKFRFLVPSRNLSFLSTPSEFLRTLLSMCSEAETRLIFAALYIGTGTNEQKIVQTLERRLGQLQNRATDGPSMRTTFLLDYLRATRREPTKEGDPASAKDLLLPLKQKYPQMADVRFFHTPLLSGLLKRVLPQRANEALGVQHMKCFVSNDNVLVTGANASGTYLTTRQDRCLLIRDRALADHCSAVVSAVADCSYSLQPDGTLQIKKGMPEPWADPQGFRARLSASLAPLSSPITLDEAARLFAPEEKGETQQTAEIRVFLQAGFAQPALRDEERSLQSLLKAAGQRGFDCTLASGYLNPPPSLVKGLSDFLKAREGGRAVVSAPADSSDAVCTEGVGPGKRKEQSEASPLTLVSAAPQANSFHNSKGITKWVTAAYASLALHLLKRLPPGVSYFEYFREGWSFHAKGVWFSGPVSLDRESSVSVSSTTVEERDEKRGDERWMPRVTVIGSSNFSCRSHSRDLEMTLVVKSNDPQLCEHMQKEKAVVAPVAWGLSALNFESGTCSSGAESEEVKELPFSREGSSELTKRQPFFQAVQRSALSERVPFWLSQVVRLFGQTFL
uniref:CDP-diacylglycerol--glycerol-3-phosphate 3-phosphatidyltransferase n=1 Tax=Chromera velia CCMP2878 TaxID=1169474 RepID=A0A0G4ID26_9ALVE|eukprot:Cvel_13204.t1-p1 / transcript=Cvel_13204.t1 / gene=Cvel_13204 / organism=Chromera_velia_CCMP2878 / gene_product=CDP-diacylglycerol--glycerol-3-phosphate, putative / transcript_product=CDP-diacylglycerol--glycerol-3-phosphate, putative / location=Cvel_scaffold893:52286-53980(-) / protein_length=565 / sequence_SO=supercontig / SO=protein_coding / is_pseudo=false